jgi:hypothetical protein
MTESGDVARVDDQTDKQKSAAPGSRRMASAFGGGAGAPKKDDREDEKLKRMEKSLAGGASGLANSTEEETKDATPKGEAKKELRGLRWVSIVATFNHRAQRDLFSRALKLEPSDPLTSPDYARVDVERQSLNDDGQWSDWDPVDRAELEKIQSVLTKIEDETELVQQDAVLKALVDPLPFLEIGYWVGTQVPALVPKQTAKLLAARNDPNQKPPTTGAPDQAPGTNPYGRGGQSEAQRRGGGMSGYGNQLRGMMSRGGGGEAGRRMGGGAAGGRVGDEGGIGSMGASRGTANYPTSDAETILVRAIDYTVEPDSIYRYRLRVVVNNPNFKRENVTPGADNSSKELFGPWSDPSSEVAVPADVATYARAKTPAGNDRAGDQVQFQVVRFDPQKGYIISRTFDHAPGQIVGELQSAPLPKDDPKGGVESKSIDFVSRQVLLDTDGGDRQLGVLGPNHANKRLASPAHALVMRADGLLVVRDQVRDTSTGEMKELEAIYRRIVEDARADASKKTSSSMGIGGLMMGGDGGGGAAGGGAAGVD